MKTINTVLAKTTDPREVQRRLDRHAEVHGGVAQYDCAACRELLGQLRKLSDDAGEDEMERVRRPWRGR